MKYSNITYQKNEGVTFVEFDLFKKYRQELTAIFSTRKGGVSSGVFATMNLSFDRGDDESLVLENYKRLSKGIGVDMNKMVFSCQHHHNNIRVVTKDDEGKGIRFDRDYTDVDGLITNVKNLPIVTFHADCAPIYFYDLNNKAIGLAHAGWKGTAMEISSIMVTRMQKEFMSNPKDLLVVIGPCICGKCYEVGEDVKAEFDKLSIDVNEYIPYDKRKQKYFLDIAAINKKLLRERGIPQNQISIANVCTMTNLDVFFSHRGHKGKRGTQVAVMMLK